LSDIFIQDVPYLFKDIVCPDDIFSKDEAFNPFLSREEEDKFLAFYNRIKSFLYSINGTTFFDRNIILTVKFREYEILSDQHNSAFLSLTSFIHSFLEEKDKKRMRRKKDIEVLNCEM
jgi:hypothetical protein